MSPTSDAQEWENRYLMTKPDALPWNAGGPDPDLVRLVESGRIAVGQAVDLGTGPGHDAVYLIEKGFNVVAVDISPSAVKMARENASHHGVFGFFQQADIRSLPIEDAFADFINDRGCFHVLPPEGRTKALLEVRRVLKRRGMFLLRVFSDKVPLGPGPHRFTRQELDDSFTPSFRILDVWEGVFEGPAKPQSYSMLMEKK